MILKVVNDAEAEESSTSTYLYQWQHEDLAETYNSKRIIVSNRRSHVCKENGFLRFTCNLCLKPKLKGIRESASATIDTV